MLILMVLVKLKIDSWCFPLSLIVLPLSVVLQWTNFAATEKKQLTLIGEIWKCSKKLRPELSVLEDSISCSCSVSKSFTMSCVWKGKRHVKPNHANLVCKHTHKGVMLTCFLLNSESTVGVNRVMIAPKKPWSIFTAISCTSAMKYLQLSMHPLLSKSFHPKQLQVHLLY